MFVGRRTVNCWFLCEDHREAWNCSMSTKLYNIMEGEFVQTLVYQYTVFK